MINVKKIGLGILFLVTIPLAYLSILYVAPQQSASAEELVTVKNVQDAQKAVHYCREAKRAELLDTYGQEALDRILAYCTPSNASELATACGPDGGNNLDRFDKYYGDDWLLSDLCDLASGYTTDGTNIRGGNVFTALVQLDTEKEAAGCYDYDTISVTSIPRAAICSLDLAKIARLCENGGILQPQYIRSAGICGDISIRTPPDVQEAIEGEVEGELEEGPDGCERGAGFLNFILCPLISGIDEGINVLDNEIRQSLEVDAAYYESDQTRALWSRIRDIAYLLLIPIMLVIVISTALGFQVVDAYTVKRAIPRLFAAVIFMVLSYDIGVFMIEIFNTIGQGVGGIIAAPFGGPSNLELNDIFNPRGFDSIGVFGTAGVLAGIAVVSFLSAGIIASYLLVAALTLVVIFSLLTIREILIIALLILGPLAILSWIFPNNDKLWKLWWGSFTKLLYVYPIVIGLLMLGRGFALLVNESFSNENSNPITGALFVLVKLVAYIGPFFFILAVFKWAGGAFGNLTGMVNDKEKGLFDRQKKYRADKRGQIKKDIAADNRFKGNSRLSKLANSKLQNAYARKQAGIKGFVPGNTGKEAMRTQKQALALEEKKHLSEDVVLQTKLLNDDFAHALTLETEAERVAYLEDKGYSEEAAQGEARMASEMRKKHGSHATTMAAIDAKAKSKTSYTGGIDEMLEDIVRASHGDQAMAMAMLGSASSVAAQAGRMDLGAGSYGEKAAMLNDKIYGNADSGQINSRQAEKALDSMSSFDWQRIHPTAAKNLVGSVNRGFQTASQDVNMRARDVADLESMSQDEIQSMGAGNHAAAVSQAKARLNSSYRTLGQKAGHMNIVKQAVAQAPPEVARIMVDGMASSDAPFAVGGESFANVDALNAHIDKLAKTEGISQEASSIVQGAQSVGSARQMSAQEMAYLQQQQDQQNT